MTTDQTAPRACTNAACCLPRGHLEACLPEWERELLEAQAKRERIVEQIAAQRDRALAENARLRQRAEKAEHRDEAQNGRLIVRGVPMNAAEAASELDRMQSIIEGLRAQRDKAEDERDSARMEVTRLGAENSELLGALGATVEERDEARDDLRRYLIELDHWRKVIVPEVRAERDAIAATLERLVDEIEQAAGELDRLATKPADAYGLAKGTARALRGLARGAKLPEVPVTRFAAAAEHDPYNCPKGRPTAQCLLDCAHKAPNHAPSATRTDVQPPTPQDATTTPQAVHGDPGGRERVSGELELVVTEGTLFKVYDALRRAGLSEQQVTDAITDMQNHGIYFREAAPRDPKAEDPPPDVPSGELLEDEDGAPFPEAVQQAHRFAVADLTDALTVRLGEIVALRAELRRVRDPKAEGSPAWALIDAAREHAGGTATWTNGETNG
jgi:hypothetical protein